MTHPTALPLPLAIIHKQAIGDCVMSPVIRRALDKQFMITKDISIRFVNVAAHYSVNQTFLHKGL